jgi:hypothetical protein
MTKKQMILGGKIKISKGLKILFPMLFLLAGCSPYQGDFDSEIPRGVPSTSLSNVARMASEGAFTRKTNERMPRVENEDDLGEKDSCEKKNTPVLREMAFREANGKVTLYEI